MLLVVKIKIFMISTFRMTSWNYVNVCYVVSLCLKKGHNTPFSWAQSIICVTPYPRNLTLKLLEFSLCSAEFEVKNTQLVKKSLCIVFLIHSKHTSLHWHKWLLNLFSRRQIFYLMDRQRIFLRKWFHQ